VMGLLIYQSSDRSYQRTVLVVLPQEWGGWEESALLADEGIQKRHFADTAFATASSSSGVALFLIRLAL
jgi:anti-sigma factor RsiW